MSLKQIKFRIRQRPLVTLVITLALVALTAVGVVAITVDLTAANSPPVKLDEAIYRGYNPTEAAGSGTFDSFVRIATTKPVIKGYNTSARPVQFDENNSPSFTRSYRLSNIPIVGDPNYPGVYREFQLDINQTSGNAIYSLDEVQVFLTTNSAILGYPFTTSPNLATEVYKLDKVGEEPTGQNNIKLNYNLAGGSGKRDMILRIPNANFLAAAGLGDDPACTYQGAPPAGSACNTWVVLYSQFGGDDPTLAGNDDGYEEWGVQVYSLATKSGTKFNDLNANGVRDTGEPGLPNWKIYVDINGDSQWDTGEPYAMTDANGAYTITGIVQGTYKVREVQQTGWTCSYPNLPGDLGTVPVHSTQCWYEEDFIAGANLTGNDFGNYQPKVNVKACKFEDVDTNPATSADRVPVAGWTVELTKNGVVQDTKTTGADGCYTWADLALPGAA